MPNIKQDIDFKINESKFHIELLEVIVKSGKTLTHQKSTEEEASYILSAILNAFYSVTELSGGNKNIKVKEFKDNHPIIYAGSGKGGLRNTTVHVSHVKIDHSGYKPPKGDAVNLNFRETPKLIMEQESQQDKNSVTLRFTPDFYIEVQGELKNVIDLCTQHLYELENFIKNNDINA